MLVIGVAGGVASGKSLVTKCLEHFGASVLDADKLGHEVLQQPEVIEQIVARWGTSVLTDERTIDRKYLAGIVFASGAEGQLELAALESITHPRIAELIRVRMSEIQSVVQPPALVLDAPVMFKAKWDLFCDKIVFVDTPLELRQRRASDRGWAADELAKRESHQTAISEKRTRSTDVIDNSGSKHETYQALQKLWQSWGLALPDNLESPSTLFPN